MDQWPQILNRKTVYYTNNYTFYSGSVHNSVLKASVLNIFSDFDYNRSVITIAADAEFIGKHSKKRPILIHNLHDNGEIGNSSNSNV